jgi:hypothetical protein
VAISRETGIGIGVSAVAVAGLAVDHLIGTESEAGEEDSFPVDAPAFFLGSGLAVALALVLFTVVVRRATGDEPSRVARKAIACSGAAVLTLPLLFLGLPFPFAGAGIALGLLGRDAHGARLATAAVALGTLVVALGAAAYVVALVT